LIWEEKQGGFANSVAISDSSAIRVKVWKDLNYENCMEMDIKGFRGRFVWSKWTEIMSIWLLIISQVQDTSHVIYEKLTLKWTFLSFLGVPSRLKHSENISIWFRKSNRFIRSRVMPRTWFVRKWDRKILRWLNWP
jgi:hypothetical protein